MNKIIEPIVSNICAKFNTGCEIELNDIIDNDQFIIFKSKKYDASRFSGLVAKLSDSKITLIIFKSGVVIQVGGKTEKELLDTAYDFAFLLAMLLNYRSNVVNFNVTNICGSADFGQRIDLNKLYSDRKKQCSYEVELYVNMKYRINGRCLTICHTGKIFGTGFKSIAELNEIFSECYNEVSAYLIKG